MYRSAARLCFYRDGRRKSRIGRYCQWGGVKTGCVTHAQTVLSLPARQVHSQFLLSISLSQKNPRSTWRYCPLQIFPPLGIHTSRLLDVTASISSYFTSLFFWVQLIWEHTMARVKEAHVTNVWHPLLAEFTTSNRFWIWHPMDWNFSVHHTTRGKTTWGRQYWVCVHAPSILDTS